MDFGVTLDTSTFSFAMQQLAERDLRIATVWALNDMATDIHKDLGDRMDVVFDRPTPWTKNAFMVVNASTSRLEAAVQLKPSASRRHYLRVQEAGGPRAQTGFEAQLSRSLVHEGVIQAIIPADNARLDQYGNWARPERNQVQSALKAQRDGATNMTDASWRRARKRRDSYFVPQSGLTPGIYKKDRQGRIGIVAIFTPKVPVYQQRLGFYEHAERLFAARMADHLGRTFGQMLAKRFG